MSGLGFDKAKEEEEEEEDYMSDAFLAQCLPKDVKPGLNKVKLFQLLTNPSFKKLFDKSFRF